MLSKLIDCILKLGKIQNFIININNNNKYQKEGIKHLRKFHNLIKTRLIVDNCKKIKAESLLDVACGRGGDIHKWIQAKLKFILAFDNHKESIFSDTKKKDDFDGAIARFKQIMASSRTKLPFTKFYYLDILKPDILEKINNLDSNKLYDVVSCQFAFHYFTKDNDMINNVLSTISSKLKQGGIFIGTATDGDIIYNILQNGDVSIPLLTLLKNKDIKNSYLFYITEETEKIKNIEITKNYFEIQGVSSEFYLFKEQFKKIAEKHNLELIEFKSFYEWYTELSSEKNIDLENMTIYEFVISFLNFSFIFKKI